VTSVVTAFATTLYFKGVGMAWGLGGGWEGVGRGRVWGLVCVLERRRGRGGVQSVRIVG
jgi:hypothetical protein